MLIIIEFYLITITHRWMADTQVQTHRYRHTLMLLYPTIERSNESKEKKERNE